MMPSVTKLWSKCNNRNARRKWKEQLILQTQFILSDKVDDARMNNSFAELKAGQVGECMFLTTVNPVLMIRNKGAVSANGIA